MADLRAAPFSPLVRGAASAAGTALGVTFAVVAGLRRSKPLHPVGSVASAVLTVTPAVDRSGSPLLDEPGDHDCVVRASWAVGSGPELPDIEGLAMRVLDAGADARPVDILFASTGTGPLTRYVLAVRTPGGHAGQTTLLPVRSAGRPLELRLDPVDADSQPWPTRYELSWAHGRGAWNLFGVLEVAWHGTADAPERFDPVANPLPGTCQYAAVAALREPAYHFARLARPSAGRLPTATERRGASR